MAANGVRSGMAVAAALLCACAGGSYLPPTTPTVTVVPPAAPPPALRTVRGAVLDPEGRPLADVKVTSPFLAVTFTDSAGAFAIPYPVMIHDSIHVTAEAEGYEPFIIYFPGLASSGDVELSTVRMIGKLFVTASDPLSAVLSSSDPGYYVGDDYDSDFCRPCKIVRLQSNTERRMTLTLEWSGVLALQLWASTARPGFQGGVVTAAAPPGESRVTLAVTAFKGETVLHVGVHYLGTPVKPIPFTLTATPQ